MNECIICGSNKIERINTNDEFEIIVFQCQTCGFVDREQDEEDDEL